jgi:hypothetical protein
MKRAKHYEFDVVPPVVPLVISLSLHPEEVEMAIATWGQIAPGSDHACAGRSASCVYGPANRLARSGRIAPKRLGATDAD